MNKELIIQMARDTGATPYTNRHYPDRPTHTFNVEQLERFFQLATEWEREECAKVCDDIFRHWIQTDPDEKFATPDADDCARAIRARGESK